MVADVASPQPGLAGWFEGGPEEGPDVFEAFVERPGGQRIPVEKRLHKADVAEIAEQGPVAGDHQLLGVMAAEATGGHLPLEKPAGPIQLGLEGGTELNGQPAAALERFSADQAHKLRVLPEEGKA